MFIENILMPLTFPYNRKTVLMYENVLHLHDFWVAGSSHFGSSVRYDLLPRTEKLFFLAGQKVHLNINCPFHTPFV